MASCTGEGEGETGPKAQVGQAGETAENRRLAQEHREDIVRDAVNQVHLTASLNRIFVYYPLALAPVKMEAAKFEYTPRTAG